ncbi:MAG: glycosyltransferase [Bacteroidetes bacterium]|nr:glycosyltransferase [Bacteroidota bacterium]
MKIAPIVLFVYNRPLHTQKTIDALLKNNLASESELYIFSDGYKDTDKNQTQVENVRNYIKTIKGFKNIIIFERKKNLGLSRNIIDGVTSIIDKYGKIIVLEDDLLTSTYFLKFMNEALSLYEHQDEVISVHGYIYPIKEELPETFFIKGADCLGWGTWKRGWDLFNPDASILLNKIIKENKTKEFNYGNSYPYFKMLKKQAEGNVDSWAIRWYASAFLKEKLTLYPYKSLVFHNGSDGSGTNFPDDRSLDVNLLDKPICLKLLPVEENKVAKKAFENYFRKVHSSYLKLIIRRIKRIIKIDLYEKINSLFTSNID